MQDLPKQKPVVQDPQQASSQLQQNSTVLPQTGADAVGQEDIPIGKEVQPTTGDQPNLGATALQAQQADIGKPASPPPQPSPVSQPSLSQPSLTPNIGVPPPTSVPPPAADVRSEAPKITTDGGGKGKPWKLIVILFLVFSLLAGSLVIGAGVMVAYGMIPLENQQLKETITKFVMSIPFLPKTSEYVLARSVLAHQEVSSATVDASIASNSKSVTSVFGGQNFDLSISGPVDLTERDHPKLSLRLQLTSELDSEVRVDGDDLYFKIDKLPVAATSMITAMFGEAPGFTGFDPLLGKWVHHKFEKLDTDARQVLEENKEEGEVFDTVYSEFIQRVFREKILPEVQMSTENVDGYDTHKLYVNLSGVLIDEVFKEIGELEKERRGSTLDIEDSGTKPSDVIKRLVISVWIDKKSYYLRKATVETRFDQSSLLDSRGQTSSIYGSLIPSLSESIDMVFSLKLSKIGEPVTVEIPAETMTTEEFMTEAMKLLGMGSMMQTQMDMARFNGARSEVYAIANAAEMYKVDIGRYPETLEKIIDAGYMSDSSLVNQEEYQVKYKVTADGSVALVFSLMTDTSNYEKPYYAYVSGDPDYSQGNFSGQELADILTKHGLGVNPILYEPISVPDYSQYMMEEQGVGDFEDPSAFGGMY